MFVCILREFVNIHTFVNKIFLQSAIANPRISSQMYIFWEGKHSQSCKLDDTQVVIVAVPLTLSNTLMIKLNCVYSWK